MWDHKSGTELNMVSRKYGFSYGGEGGDEALVQADANLVALAGAADGLAGMTGRSPEGWGSAPAGAPKPRAVASFAMQCKFCVPPCWLCMEHHECDILGRMKVTSLPMDRFNVRRRG